MHGNRKGKKHHDQDYKCIVDKTGNADSHGDKTQTSCLRPERQDMLNTGHTDETTTDWTQRWEQT